MEAPDYPSDVTELDIVAANCGPAVSAELANLEAGAPLSQARVVRADNGFEVPLGKLARTDERPVLWSMNDRMRLVRRRMTGHVSISSRQAYRVSLASGRQLDLSSDQQVMKLDGWVSSAKLGQR